MHSTTYNTDKPQGPTVQHRELHSISYNNLQWKTIRKRTHTRTHTYTIHMVSTSPNFLEAMSLDSFHCENGGQNVHSKQRERDEEPLIDQVQLTGQLAGTSSKLPPPTIQQERVHLQYYLPSSSPSIVYVTCLNLFCVILFKKNYAIKTSAM